MCDAIPGVVQEFRGAVGALNRPFAIPNDDGEEILVRLRPGTCDPGSTGFVDHPGGLAPEDDYFVTVLFEPPGDGPRNAVVIGTTANRDRCAARLAEAEPLPKGVVATCAGSIPGRSDLAIHGECVGGSRSGQRCADDSPCPGATCEPVVLRFRFPDTDALLGSPDDDLTLTGPATIAVTPASEPLPLVLATARCADTPGLTACIDELYARDGTCETDPPHVDPTFGHFAALPPANDYQALCTTDAAAGGPCRPVRDRELRLTVDAAGNALLPMDYRGVLIESNQIPVPRLIRGRSRIAAFPGGRGGAVPLPGDDLIDSYSPGGHKLPPRCTPARDPDSPGGLGLFGLVAAPVGVIRVQGRACVGGPSPPARCTADAQCGDGSCQLLFDLSARAFAGVGPVLVSDFELETENPVPLDGRIESESVFAFVQTEAIAGATDEAGRPGPRDLNGDADATDPVLVLRDRETGQIQPIGAAVAGVPTQGRAATRIREPPSSFPAVAVEGDLVAFLEPEPLQFAEDANGDGDVFDTVLRVYRLASGCAPGSGCPAEELTAGMDLAIDAAPLVGGRSLAVSDGRVFFRTSEAGIARQRTDLVRAGAFLSLSGSGRYAAWWSSTPPENGTVSVFDRETGETSPIPPLIGPISALSRLTTAWSLSHTGRFVALANGFGLDSFTFVHDRESGETLSLALPPPPVEYVGPLTYVPTSISADGRFVAVLQQYYVEEVVVPPPPFPPRTVQRPVRQLFVHDRETGVSTPIVASLPGIELGVFPGQLSADGRLVATAGVLSPGLGLPRGGLFLVDHESGEISSGSPILRFGQLPSPLDASSISGDGRFAAFASSAGDLVPGDTNGACDVFVHDRESARTTRVSVASDGSQQDDGFCESSSLIQPVGSLSEDGRFVAFGSVAGNLAPGASGGTFVHDRLTALTRLVDRLSVPYPRLSADGRVVGFAGRVSGPDPGDLEADLTGDGSLDDTVLQVLDTTTGHLQNLGPAGEVAVWAGSAAFLVPRDGAPHEAFLSRDGQIALPLHRAAVSIAMSAGWIAARVPSGPDGATFAEVYDWDSPNPAWVPTGSEAIDLDVVDTPVAPGVTLPTVALLTSDRALRVYRAARGLLDVAVAVEEFVLGERLLAFRIGECALGGPVSDEDCPTGGTDLNGDGDARDRVLHVYDLVSERLFNTGSAAIPCPLEACDARFPYRVAGDTAIYITAEAQQDRDLNEDGVLGFVKQVFNAREAAALVPAVGSFAQASRAGTAPAGGCVDTIAAAPSGICTNTGEACSCESPEACEAACGAGSCFLPPGECIGDGAVRGSCATDADCAGFGEGIACSDAAEDVQRLFAPIAAPGPGAGEMLVSAGRCVETGAEGRRHGSCRTDADCQSGLVCSAGLIVAGAADSDADDLADPFDNCPEVANSDQVDFDGDGVGDACDLLSCGNGARESTEACDDANRADGDGCSAACELENRPPECGGAVASVEILWPPNHQSRPVGIEGLVDPDGDRIAVAIASIFQDEPVKEKGGRSSSPDGTGIGSGGTRLRAERSGSGDGRVYHVAFEARDERGASCSGRVRVCVPHDRGRGSRCGDQGPRFDSTH